jgi:hypothetical protein
MLSHVADDSMLSDRDRELFERPNIGHLATLNDDGSPQVSPVWVDVEGDLVCVNSSRGRVKVRNVERDPRVAVGGGGRAGGAHRPVGGGGGVVI